MPNNYGQFAMFDLEQQFSHDNSVVNHKSDVFSPVSLTVNEESIDASTRLPVAKSYKIGGSLLSARMDKHHQRSFESLLSETDTSLSNPSNQYVNAQSIMPAFEADLGHPYQFNAYTDLLASAKPFGEILGNSATLDNYFGRMNGPLSKTDVHSVFSNQDHELYQFHQTLPKKQP
jgi:hypothetical protein